MSLLNIFHISYYFDNYAEPAFRGFWIVVAVLAVLLIVTYILLYKTRGWSHYRRQILLRSTRMSLWLGWGGLVWLFFRYQGIPYFIWRLWPALIIIGVIVQAVLLVKFIRFDYPKKSKVKSVDRDEEKQRYLRRFMKGR